MSSPHFLYCSAWGVQPAKCEEDWGRGLLGCRHYPERIMSFKENVRGVQGAA